MNTTVKLVWYFISICLIFTIIIQNPKAEGSNRFYSGDFFSTEKSKKRTLNNVTWILIISFLFFTGIISIANS
nr:preprotein translocase subunit G [Boldiaceae sp.]